jgi:tRNA-uridine 2-sulfurtransferase
VTEVRNTNSILPLPDLERAAGAVVVGMSGGVDSSVTATILQAKGFDVIGMTMQIWHRSSRGEAETVSAGCCTVDAVDDARRVARNLGIRYYVPNFREPFSVVIDDFAREYAAGRTPNPCVRCNQYVRFNGLIQKADELSAEYVATGHYARIGFDRSREEFVLRKAVDRAKDQSYVLHTLQQRHLCRMITPLGNLVKSETRLLAEQFGLAVASKPDSQEICFVGSGNYRDFLRDTTKVEARPGPIVDQSGKVLGRHSGIEHYTIGQRKGLGLSGAAPSYVIELRPRENSVVIGTREDASHWSLECQDVSFTGTLDGDRFEAAVRVRSHGIETPASVRATSRGARVEFHEPVWGAAPGQLAVFYDGERVIGGGTITAIGA